MANGTNGQEPEEKAESAAEKKAREAEEKRAREVAQAEAEGKRVVSKETRALATKQADAIVSTAEAIDENADQIIGNLRNVSSDTLTKLLGSVKLVGKAAWRIESATIAEIWLRTKREIILANKGKDRDVVDAAVKAAQEKLQKELDIAQATLYRHVQVYQLLLQDPGDNAPPAPTIGGKKGPEPRKVTQKELDAAMNIIKDKSLSTVVLTNAGVAYAREAALDLARVMKTGKVHVNAETYKDKDGKLRLRKLDGYKLLEPEKPVVTVQDAEKFIKEQWKPARGIPVAPPSGPSTDDLIELTRALKIAWERCDKESPRQYVARRPDEAKKRDVWEAIGEKAPKDGAYVEVSYEEIADRAGNKKMGKLISFLGEDSGMALEASEPEEMQEPGEDEDPDGAAISQPEEEESNDNPLEEEIEDEDNPLT